MINEQHQAELEQSCELWSSAYDCYYFEMDDDEFEDAMSDIGDDYQNDPVYQAYLRQRKIGFEAISGKLTAKSPHSAARTNCTLSPSTITGTTAQA